MLHFGYKFDLFVIIYEVIRVLISADSLVVDSLLELLDEESLRKDTALPSPGWSSDHIALLAGFRCCKSKSRH
jgi:CCR4-NOT transcription complex subunit 6